MNFIIILLTLLFLNTSGNNDCLYLEDINGNDITIENNGNYIIVLYNFYSCYDCFRLLDSVFKKNKKKYVYMAVSDIYFDNIIEKKNFKNQIKSYLYLDKVLFLSSKSYNIFKKYKIHYTPAIILINKDKNIKLFKYKDIFYQDKDNKIFLQKEFLITAHFE